MRDGFEKKLDPAVLEMAAALAEVFKAYDSFDSGVPYEIQKEISANYLRRMESAGEKNNDVLSWKIWYLHRLPLRNALVPVDAICWFQFLFSEGQLRDLANLSDYASIDNLLSPRKARSSLFHAYQTHDGLQNGEKVPPFRYGSFHYVLLELVEQFADEDLTLNELADFCGIYCPCGKEHLPDALYQQRRLLRKALKRREDWRNNRPSDGWEELERLLNDGPLEGGLVKPGPGSCQW